MKRQTKMAIAAIVVILLVLGMLSALVYGFSTEQLAIFFKKLVAVPVR